MRYPIMQSLGKNAGIISATGTEWNTLGLGQVSSLIKGERFDHIRDRKAYIEKIRNGESILIDREILSVESQMEEFMYLGLRKIEGVSVQISRIILERMWMMSMGKFLIN